MSRFVNIQVPRWGVGNYSAPGKPWNTTSKQSVPAFDGFTPDAVIAAEELNSVIDSRLAKISTIVTGLQQAVGDLQATFTRALIPVSANENFRDVKYLTNTAGSATGYGELWWYVLTRNLSNNYSYLYLTKDGGTTFSLVYDGAATDPTSIGTNTVDQRCCPINLAATCNVLFSHGYTAGKIRYVSTAGAWGELTHGEGTLNANGFSSMIQRFGSGNGGIFIGYTGAATKTVNCSSTLTFTSMTASIPAALNTDQTFCGRSDRLGKVVVFSKTAGRTTYMYVNSGSNTWNSATSPVAAGESAVDVCEDGTFWYLLTNASGTYKIYQSSTGTGSWTLVRTIPNSVVFAGFDCDVGGTMMAAIYNGANLPGGVAMTTALDPSVYVTNGAVLASGQNFQVMVGTEIVGGADTSFHGVVCAKFASNPSQLSQFCLFSRGYCRFGVPMGLGGGYL